MEKKSVKINSPVDLRYNINIDDPGPNKKKIPNILQKSLNIDERRAIKYMGNRFIYGLEKNEAEKLCWKLTSNGATVHISPIDYINTLVEFGHYPQTSEGNDQTPIEWKVADIKDGKALLISDYILDCGSYDCNGNVDVNWSDCSLRAWLNDIFLNKAFTQDEQRLIFITELESQEEIFTEDKIFLLSPQEAYSYLGTGRKSSYDGTEYCDVGHPTDYAISSGIDVIKNNDEIYSRDKCICSYWLRDMGSNYVNLYGAIESEKETNYKYIGIRPAMWVATNEYMTNEYIMK